MAAIITLLTDFGTADGYVAQVKGVILSRAPGVTLVDVTHDIDAQDVEAARLVVDRYWLRFPPGTVHVVVVDPGVGSPRAAIAVSARQRFLVGPDNGVLSPAILSDDAMVVALPIPPGASPTFHGRDVFAPAAAALATGALLERLGTAHASPMVRTTPQPVVLADGAIRGEILCIDRFGNAITNISGPREGHTLWVGALGLPLHITYAEVQKGEPIALTGSSGCIEVAVREGSAARRLGLTRGSSVTLRADEHATEVHASGTSPAVARGSA